MFGTKKLQILSDEQKQYRITYQAGKVVSASYFDLAFEKLMLSNEKLTPSTDAPMIKHELESCIKMLLAGVVACELKFGEHASSAKGDLDEAKELIQRMLNDYGMGNSLIKSENEEEALMARLYSQSKDLIHSMDKVMKKVELVLYERESISKDEVLKYINEIL
jgi:cell division protease FtsH